MTAAEIKAVLPPVTIWMAKKAVMEGVRVHHKAQEEYDTEYQKEQAGNSYNFHVSHAYKEGVRVAAEILWKLFASCSAECQMAIAEVAKKRDGHFGHPEEYFDDFVNSLEIVQGRSVCIRVAE